MSILLVEDMVLDMVVMLDSVGPTIIWPVVRCCEVDGIIVVVAASARFSRSSRPATIIHARTQRISFNATHAGM